MNGLLTIVSAQDYTNAGPNFTDFKGAFYANGIVSMSFTTNFLFNVRSTYRMSFSVPVNESALRGQWMQIEPEGWDENNDAIIRLRRVM